MKKGSKEPRVKKPRVTRKEYAIQNYLELRKNKSSMVEIAKACNVTTAFLYSYVLPEVSKRFGIPHDDLLYIPQSAHVFATKPGRKPNATTDAGTTEPAKVAQEAATEPEFTGDVAPSIEEAVEEAATVQTATDVADITVCDNPSNDQPKDIVPENNNPEDDGFKAPELETENPKGLDESIMFNPILKKILENLGAVRQIIHAVI